MNVSNKLSKVSVSLPFWDLVKVEWVPDEAEVRAAWALYVELSTRIAVVPLSLDEGLLREAFSSLHALFGETRAILRMAGPKVGVTRASLGGLALTVLNKGIRPFLAKWHPQLDAWESQRPPGVSRPAHERAWEHEASARGELEKLNRRLMRYAAELARIAGVR